MTRRLWGLAAYFNPAGSPRRLDNFRAFRRDLQVPLVAVELAYGDGFELGADDADIMIRLRGGDVLWQKERLLNIALGALPAGCEAVAWLDADIRFSRPDWARLALAGLEKTPVLQPFRDVFDLAPGTSVDGPARASRQSLAFRVAEGALAPEQIAAARLLNDYRCAAGLAWAARREIMDRHGFYDACIVGGGDRAMACAAYGSTPGLEAAHHLNSRQMAHYLAWARPFSAAVGGQVGHVDGAVISSGHGSLQGRAYGERHAGLARFGFDPAVDIALDGQGCWRWNSPRPELHEYVRGYFRQRGD